MPKVVAEKQPITVKGKPRGEGGGLVNSPRCGWSCDGSFASFYWPTLSLSLVFITAVMMLCAQARPTLA